VKYQGCEPDRIPTRAAQPYGTMAAPKTRLFCDGGRIHPTRSPTTFTLLMRLAAGPRSSLPKVVIRIWEGRIGLLLGEFGDERLAKRGAFLAERLVANGGKGVSVRRLGGNRAGEMRITRFLHNPKVKLGEMMSRALARTCA